MNEMVNKLIDILLPFAEFDKRVYYLYLATAIIMASTLYFSKYRHKKSPKSIIAFLFPTRLLFHPSNFTDFFLYLFNALFKVFFLLPYFTLPIKYAISMQKKLNSFFPNFQQLEWDVTSIGILYTLSLFLLTDFSRFLLHWTFHQIPFLWKLHRVHHSAKILTPMSVYRTHPIESIIFYARGIFVTAFISGIFLFIFKGKIQAITILQLNIFGFLFNLIGSNLRHTHIWFSYGSMLENYFISPAMHQLHHSRKEKYNTKNMGACLSIWDKIFQTWHPPVKAQNHHFGLPKEANADKG